MFTPADRGPKARRGASRELAIVGVGPLGLDGPTAFAARSEVGFALAADRFDRGPRPGLASVIAADSPHDRFGQAAFRWAERDFARMKKAAG